ncbi:MAG: trigger factor [Deltaproteobacteria bacterium]|nr:trigger factor [Deltaproteobacteria bacterium]
MTETKIEDLSVTKKKINIMVSKETISNCLNRAYQKVGNTAKINGFRPGKIPHSILDKYHKAEIDFELLNFAIADSYARALTDNKLTPITEPKFDAQPVLRDKDYSYSVEIEIRPQFEIKDYKNIEVKKQEVVITDQEIEDELKRLQESLAQLAPAKEDAVLTKGLVATIDFDGKMDGKKFEAGTAKDYVFEYGVGQLLKEFEDKIEGMKKEESRVIDITFPDDYFEKQLAGKQASYDIKIKNLHVKTLPELDDEMAKDIGKANLGEVKEELKKSITLRKEREIRRDHGEEIKQKLLADHEFEVPQSFIDSEVERTKKDKAEVLKMLRLEFILQEIAERENLTVTPQEMEQRMMLLSHMYRQPLDQIRKLYAENNMKGMLATQIVFEKTIDLLVDQAKQV